MEFETCHSSDCAVTGKHAHPVGGPSQNYWLRVLQGKLSEAQSINKQIAYAASQLAAARAR